MEHAVSRRAPRVSRGAVPRAASAARERPGEDREPRTGLRHRVREGGALFVRQAGRAVYACEPSGGSLIGNGTFG